MGPSRTSKDKYNYSEEILTAQIECPHCGKKFKKQGFKNHEVNCKRRKDIEEERKVFGREYERDERIREFSIKLTTWIILLIIVEARRSTAGF